MGLAAYVPLRSTWTMYEHSLRYQVTFWCQWIAGDKTIAYNFNYLSIYIYNVVSDVWNYPSSLLTHVAMILCWYAAKQNCKSHRIFGSYRVVLGYSGKLAHSRTRRLLRSCCCMLILQMFMIKVKCMTDTDEQNRKMLEEGASISHPSDVNRLLLYTHWEVGCIYTFIDVVICGPDLA